MQYINMLLLIWLSSCANYNHAYEIVPLHPYRTTLPRNDTDSNGTVTKYFFIRGAKNATEKLSAYVDSFLLKMIERDPDFKQYDSYTIVLYRESEGINENFRQEYDGMISYSLLSEHEDDLLFLYDWLHGSFQFCIYYKKGKVISTKYDKGNPLLKGKEIDNDKKVEYWDVEY